MKKGQLPKMAQGMTTAMSKMPVTVLLIKPTLDELEILFKLIL
jgi:hypothetical protein